MFTTNSKIYKFKAAAIFLFFSLIGELISSEPGKITTQIQQLINELEIKKHQLQGGAIAILHKGKIVYKTTFGKQNGQSGQITPKTLFPLASVSKVVSATAIALIADKGIINLDEKFSLPFLRNPVSLINVLSHTTGYEFSGNAEVEQGMSRANILNLIKKQQPRSKPGQFYVVKWDRVNTLAFRRTLEYYKFYGIPSWLT